MTSASATVSDVWTDKDAGPVTAGVWKTGEVSSLDARFVIFEPAPAAGTASGEDGSASAEPFNAAGKE